MTTELVALTNFGRTDRLDSSVVERERSLGLVAVLCDEEEVCLTQQQPDQSLF